MIEFEIDFERAGQLFYFKALLPPEGVTAIFGPSGAGKTTLINLIAGIDTPNKGFLKVGERLFFDTESGLSVDLAKRNIGYVFQDDRLFPHLSVKDNICYGGNSTQRFAQLVELLGLDKLLAKRPNRLSGGEKKRVAIARALMTNPTLLLLDEPMNGLDAPRQSELITYLKQLVETVNLPVLIVTHQVNEIFQLASHLVVIDSGRIVASGEASKTWSAQAVRPFLAEGVLSAILQAEVTHYHTDYNMTALSLGGNERVWINGQTLPLGSAIMLNVAASDVSLSIHKVASSVRNCLKAQIVEIDKNSHPNLITIVLSVAEQRLLANITDWALDELKLNIGDFCYAMIKGVRVTPVSSTK
ncbi:molybdenum ABC transporter ATP-binding protein [Thaumasiovibrio subtropicus]|uniref:molybdenum ABC transporter ATP-binding protein n=1 Tax=Thaumasiovibrio subtropicus TaxID=1891207 RepID=UPI00131CCBF7|nr:molybdenum ABC transporter ATP-binding protein [Thaumasiovibrio subtropicus]